jgi:hypothetical protein
LARPRPGHGPNLPGAPVKMLVRSPPARPGGPR